MRSALTIAAFAAGALAVPFNKRDMVTAYDIQYVTDVVTVTAGYPLPTEVSKVGHYGHGHKIHHSVSSVVEQITSTIVQQPAYTPPVEIETSTSTPTPEYTPPPAPTSTPEPETSTYVAPAPTSSEAESAPAAAPTDYQEIVLYHHNIHRKNHTVDDLQWDDALAASAQIIAASCVYAHNVDVNGGGYGQNIAAGVSNDNVSAVITDLFYNGEEPLYAGNYGAPNPDMSNFEGWGHFSQIVWKGTTHVACATQYCPGGLGNVGSGVSPYFTVCNYSPPGNYEGEYGSNVLEPMGEPTAQWNAGLSGGAGSY